jgi:cell division protein FtsB
MGMLREIRRRAGAVWPPVLGLCTLGYFAYHAVHGERGLLAYWRLQSEIAQAEQELAASDVERRQLEQRVSLLRADNLDPDMLEERARIVLNYVRDDELVILADR